MPVGVVMLAGLALAGFLLTNAHGRNLPQRSMNLGGVIPFIFVAFVFLIAMVVPVLREKRNLPLLRDGELALATVVNQRMVQQGKSSCSQIEYEFKSNTGQRVCSSCRDLTRSVFEEMTVPVFYDPLDPSKNVAACATYLKVADPFR